MSSAPTTPPARQRSAHSYQSTPSRRQLRSDELLMQAVSILESLQAEHRHAPAWLRHVKFALSMLQASTGVNAATVRETLETEANEGEIDENTVEWVTATLKIDPRDSAVVQSGGGAFGSAARAGGRGGRHGGLALGGGSSTVASSHNLLGDDGVAAMVADVMSWDFDVFALVGRLRRRFLGVVATEVFSHFRLFPSFDLDTTKFVALMDKLEATYCYDPHSPNPYHNAIHATDVLQGVSVFCTERRIRNVLEDLDMVALLIASVVHDYRHPGVSNNFLAETSSTLAIRYNDDSVLENFHAASAFEILCRRRYNIFAKLDTDVYRQVRRTIIACVLATDLAKGNAHIVEFTNTVLLPAQAAAQAAAEAAAEVRSCSDAAADAATDCGTASGSANAAAAAAAAPGLQHPIMAGSSGSPERRRSSHGGVPLHGSVATTLSSPTAGMAAGFHQHEPATELLHVMPLPREAALVLMKMTLKCADVSHPTRAFKHHLRWSNMVPHCTSAGSLLSRTL